MPKVRAVDEMNETELRAEMVSLLADAAPSCEPVQPKPSVPY